MNIYYVAQTDGDHTNLQLFALMEAKRVWRDAVDYFNAYGEDAGLTEMCVFAIASLGLSVSQLLGQNDPKPVEKVRMMGDIFPDFAAAYGVVLPTVDQFKKFNNTYNGIRHFGATSRQGEGHKRVNDLTFALADELFEIGVRVWYAVVGVHADSESDLNSFVIDGLGELANRYPYVQFDVPEF